MLTPAGWAVAHAGINLLDPGRYVERHKARDKVARAVELSESDLSPTGRVWQPEDLSADAETPDVSFLAARGVTECAECGARHETAWACLL
jgi:hypothetical protein